MKRLSLIKTCAVGRAGTFGPPSEDQDEAGAILILAMIFLVVVSLVVLALLNWVGTSLTATASFSNERSVEYAATDAVNLAIQNTRYTFSTQLENASPPQACWYDSNGNPQQPQAIDGISVDVWCSMVWQPFSQNSRIITYSACPTTETTDPGTCGNAPLLQASVTFDDFAPGLGVPPAHPVQCSQTGLCGQSMTQNSWQWNPTVPSVSSISPTSGSINGGTTVTIQGSGFVAGSSVNFIQETGGSGSPANTPTTDQYGAGNVITIQASQVTFVGCSGPGGTNCTLTVPAPAVMTGTDYFVTITTTGGTSSYLSSHHAYVDFQYSFASVVPSVSAISGALVPNQTYIGGSITGGSTITITGSGFYNASNFAAQVWFWSGTNKFQATNVIISSNSTMTANSPSVTTTGNYYVQVVTFGGQSANPNSAAIFNYGVQVPFIIGLSPTSGGRGTNATITITGGNFLTGSTVGFCLDTNGTYASNCVTNGTGQISATSTVVNGSSITVVPPTSLAVGSKYFPVITLPSPYTPANGYPASQPYNEPADIYSVTS